VVVSGQCRAGNFLRSTVQPLPPNSPGTTVSCLETSSSAAHLRGRISVEKGDMADAGRSIRPLQSSLRVVTRPAGRVTLVIPGRFLSRSVSVTC
jgi:hypothetical protein